MGDLQRRGSHTKKDGVVQTQIADFSKDQRKYIDKEGVIAEEPLKKRGIDK